MVTALIFAGGVGARMKSVDIPKQFLEGRYILKKFRRKAELFTNWRSENQ